MIELEIVEKVQRLIRLTEETQDVRVLLAVESGSRAWGFPSRDSDYDVRFVYIHRKEWYLSIDSESKRDVIERPVEDLIDLSGWDIRKALRLFAKANPPLIEWLSSPIVYVDDGTVRPEMERLLAIYYEPRSCMYHYMHMAERNYRDYLKGPVVWIKKYLYVLRPVLAIKWIEQDRGPVPMEFNRLLVTIEEQRTLINEIAQLISRKLNGDELDRGPENAAIGKFIENEMKMYAEKGLQKTFEAPDYGPLNTVFGRLLENG
jgi:predicted nucleotidyltransferase